MKETRHRHRVTDRNRETHTHTHTHTLYFAKTAKFIHDNKIHNIQNVVFSKVGKYRKDISSDVLVNA